MRGRPRRETSRPHRGSDRVCGGAGCPRAGTARRMPSGTVPIHRSARSVMEALFASPWGPLVIFALRVVDVSLATLRMLLSVRGMKKAVPFIGAVEVLVWLYAVGNAIQHLDSPLH